MLIKILRHNEKWLKRLPNVHHVGISNKLRDGADTRRPSITIYVTCKQPETGSNRVPRRLTAKIGGVTRSIQTDVCELAGAPRLFAMRGGARIISADAETGTAGLVFAHHGKNYCMTNAHVVSDPGNMNSNSVAVAAPINGAGTVVRRDALPFDQEIESDAALILLNTGVDSWQFYNQPGVLVGFVDELAIGQTCFYAAPLSGNATHATLRCELIVEVHGNAAVEVDGSFLTYRDFYRFRVVNGSPVGGHSGALIYLQAPNGLFGVGLAFGGIEGSEIWAFPARRCFDRMMKFF